LFNKGTRKGRAAAEYGRYQTNRRGKKKEKIQQMAFDQHLNLLKQGEPVDPLKGKNVRK